jgi:hypothetical protein
MTTAIWISCFWKLLFLEIFEDVFDGPALGDYEDLPREVAGRHVGVHVALEADGAQDVLDVDGTHDPVRGVLLVDGVSSVVAGGDGRDQVSQPQVFGDGHDVGPRDHDLTRRLVL